MIQLEIIRVKVWSISMTSKKGYFMNVWNKVAKPHDMATEDKKILWGKFVSWKVEDNILNLITYSMECVMGPDT